MVWSQIFPFLPRIRVARAPFPIFLDYPGTLASGFGHLPVGASSDLLTNENVDIQNLILKSQGGLTWRVKFYPQQFIEYTGSVSMCSLATGSFTFYYEYFEITKLIIDGIHWKQWYSLNLLNSANSVKMQSQTLHIHLIFRVRLKIYNK